MRTIMELMKTKSIMMMKQFKIILEIGKLMKEVKE